MADSVLAIPMPTGTDDRSQAEALARKQEAGGPESDPVEIRFLQGEARALFIAGREAFA